MLVLENGRVGVFVLVIGGEAANDFGWDIHQRTQEAQRSEFAPWGDGDAWFRVINDAIDLDDKQLSFFVHSTPHAEWGVPKVADVVMSTGDELPKTHLPVLEAKDFERPFEGFKRCVMVALTQLRRTEPVPALLPPRDNVIVSMLEAGEAALGTMGEDDPLAALTRLSPGWRVGYSAAYVDSQVRNGGFPQLVWNVVAAGQNSVIGGGADALRTLGLDAAGELVDEALIRTMKVMDILLRNLPDGPAGFAAFRDQSNLSELNDRYFEETRDLAARLKRFANDVPEYFVTR